MPSTKTTVDPSHWALSVAVSQDFLNGLAAEGVGDGIEAAELRQVFHLPMMGEVDLQVSMTITAVRFVMEAAHGGRLHATISAAGAVAFGGDQELPPMPGLARVRGEVLVEPIVEMHEDGTFLAVLDLAGSELVAMHFDGIDGIEADAGAQAMMGQLLFQTVGGDLFSGLAEQMGTVGLELDAARGAALAELGVRPGPAEVIIDDGRLVVGLPAVEGLAGTAAIAPIEATHLGVGLAAGSLSGLVRRLVTEQLRVPLPFDVEVDTSERRVGGRVRNKRLVASRLVPDLRAGLRYTLRPRLVGDRLEVSVREAWLELPVVPPVINQVSRFVGGAASRAPLTVSIPATVALPVRPDSDVTMDVVVSRLDVGDDGITLVVDAFLEEEPA